MEFINRPKYDPTAVDVLSYIDEDEGLSAATSEADFDADGDPFAYEERLHAAIDLRRAVIKKIGVSINDDNINAVLAAADLSHRRPDDINRIAATL